MPSASPRDRLLAAAGNLFYTQGVSATGVDALVRAADVTKPTLYAHFGSKSELVAAALLERLSQRRGELEAWLDPVSVPERPAAVFDWLADFYAGGGERGCGFLNAAAELPDAADPARRVVTSEKAWFVGLFARLAADAGLKKPARLASQLLLLVDGVGGRILVGGPEAAAGAVADARAAAIVLIAAAQ